MLFVFNHESLVYKIKPLGPFHFKTSNLLCAQLSQLSNKFISVTLLKFLVFQHCLGTIYRT